MSKKLYTLEEAQDIWTKIIRNRSEELKKDLIKESKAHLKTKKVAYV